MISKFKVLFKGLFFKENEKKFYNFLSENYERFDNNDDTVVLIEFSTVYANIIGLYFFLKALRKKTKATFVSYIIYPPKLWTPLLLLKYKRIYKKLGINKFIHSYPNASLDREIDNYLEKNPIKLKDKRDLELLEFEGVWVGDVIYDSYLYKYTLPTVDLNSEELKTEIREALFYFLFWKKYFQENKITQLLVSHTVYTHFTIISRLAVFKNIEVFQVNDAGLYRLSSRQRHAYHEFFDFKVLYNNLPAKIQEQGKEWAKRRLDMRFTGKVGVDMSYSTKSAWTKDEKCEFVIPSPRKKIFLALHCFFDSPHPYGLNLFPDFYEWIDFLGKISERTDYDWYLKTHPDFLPGNNKIVASFTEKYKKFTVIPPTTSHHSLIKSGIDTVLTVYGTVGMEYAFQKIPVVNASLNNIHIAFNFNVHPKSVEEYEQILLNLDSLKCDINQDEILEYYFVKNFLCQQSWIWKNFDEMIKAIGGVGGQAGPNIIDHFFNEYSLDFEKKALSNADSFLNSNQYCLIADVSQLEKQLSVTQT